MKANSISKLCDSVKCLSEEYINLFSKIIPFSNSDSLLLIDENTQKKYLNINETLIGLLIKTDDFRLHTDIDYYSYDNYLLNWIVLGSALESSMQIFLTAYLTSYKNNPLRKWENFDFTKVDSWISKRLFCLQKIDVITSKQRKSLYKDFKKVLEIKRDGVKLETVMLNDLINYFCKEVWEHDTKSLKEKLENICQNRNSIHSFNIRNIHNWENMIESINAYIEVLLLLISGLKILEPLVDDLISEYSSDN